MSAKITVDHLDGQDGYDSAAGTVINTMPQYGIERVLGMNDSIPGAEQEIKFRLYDDDGELYFEGELDDDEECENQSAVLRWGESYAGCTRIEVERDGEWKVEIA